MNIFYLLLASVLFNLVMFLPAFWLKTDKFTDISYSLSFIGLAVFAYLTGVQSDFGLVLLILVCVWAVRLGAYLFIRINKIGKDKRFDGMRDKFFNFMGFWLLQGVTVWVVLIPSLMVWSNGGIFLSWISYLGAAVFGLGVLIEGVADYQKFVFKNDPANKGRWIDKGLWGLSRHPNYLGEMMVWIGAYLYCFPVLSGYEIWLGLVSPAYIIGLLMFVSGVPMLEKSADEKWGSDEAYQEYKKKTGVILPKI